MIYTGYFENKIGKIISASFDTQESDRILSNLDLTISSSDINSVTTSNRMFQYNIGTKKITIENTTLNYRLCEIRLFKGVKVSITKTAGGQCRYAQTNLQKDYSNNVGFLTDNETLGITPTHDGYLLINMSMTTKPIVRCLTRRQRVDDSLIFSEDPITISNKSEGIFAPLKLNSATVRIMTDKTLLDLYTTNKQGVKCTIENVDDDVVLFRGYVTPNMYSQNYNYVNEELEIECVSPFSALDKTRLQEPQDNLVSWYDLLKEVFFLTDYDSFILHDSMDIDGNNIWVKHTYVDKHSLLDDDNKYIYLKDVLERFTRTFGFSLYEINGEVFLLDVGLLNEEEITYTKYVLDDDTTEVYTPIEPIGFRYGAGKHSLSFDDCYNNVKITSSVEQFDDIINDIDDEEDLICLHPNIPYIVYSGNTDFYTDGNHVDIYRVYLNRKYNHYSYNSNFSDTTYGVDAAPSTMSTRTFATLMQKTDNEQWKAEFNTYLRNHLCCFIVKRFSYSYTLYGTEAIPTQYPTKFDFTTEILISYGLKGWVLGDYSTAYQSGYSANLKSHYLDVYTKPILESKDTYNVTLSNDYKTYLMFNGSVYFMREQYPRYDVNIFNDTLHKDTLANYTAMRRGVANYFNYYNTNNFCYDHILNNISQDKAYEGAKEFLYKWHGTVARNENFWANIPNLDGDAIEITGNTEIAYRIYPPQPNVASNNLQATFALLHDIRFDVVKSYPIDYAMDNKTSTDDVEYTFGGQLVNDDDTLEITIPYHTQTDDREVSKNSLIYYKDGFKYLSNQVYPYRQNPMTIEQKIGYNNNSHYSKPKLIYNLSIFAISHNYDANHYDRDGSYKITPVTVLLASMYNGYLSFVNGDAPFKYFIMDEMEYNILEDYKAIKLIEL